jgi:hypothetical protein
VRTIKKKKVHTSDKQLIYAFIQQAFIENLMCKCTVLGAEDIKIKPTLYL